MLIGPVFRAELVRAARRRIAYWMRSCYALVLLFVIWTHYAPLAVLDEARGLYFQDVARFALETFTSFMAVQIVALLLLIPALCGGVVADEKQRKTFHYLMASQLTSREIIGDKLLARLFALGIYVLLGLPVMSLLGLFGGVPWEYVIVGYTATLSISLFAASLSVFVSVFARRVRQGILIAYLFEIGWLIGPSLISDFLEFVFPSVHAWLGPVCDYAVASSPVTFVYRAVMRRPRLWRGQAALLLQFYEMVGLQVAGTLLLLLLAILLLRPVFRRQEEKPRRLNWFGHRPRLRVLARPPCGDDAMLWKERHFTRTDVFTKLVVLPATVVLTVGLILSSQLDEVVGRALRDLWTSQSTGSADRAQIASAIQYVSQFYIALWLLAVAGAAASCITVEREQDTWVSLISSPLSAWEIVRGKVLGAVWGLRGFGAFLLLFWLAGLLLGAVSLWGLLLAALALGVLTWFVAALGTLLSLRARNTARALTGTLLALFLLNGGCLAFVAPFWALDVISPNELEKVLFTPALISSALTVPEAIHAIGELATLNAKLAHRLLVQQLVYGAIAVLLYASAAVVLTARTAAAFDRISDRPSTSSDQPLRRTPAPRGSLALSRTTD